MRFLLFQLLDRNKQMLFHVFLNFPLESFFRRARF